jgi:hypothetical protein
MTAKSSLEWKLNMAVIAILRKGNRPSVRRHMLCKTGYCDTHSKLATEGQNRPTPGFG